ncbi:TetR/AcrR family transcriptional regulator C-terminal domain-containing protein [Amycolatopsis roodepoortensis]|nr:TetR/AcrR family transcriptional regulator C-terminal domain-containing protein [Amycolatopsis roodepoortensis]
MTVSGHLRTADPLLAADLFFALLSGPADKRARPGTRRTPDAELRAIAEAAVGTFLKAFGAQDRGNVTERKKGTIGGCSPGLVTLSYSNEFLREVRGVPWQVCADVRCSRARWHWRARRRSG